jgi:hypothetical protein
LSPAANTLKPGKYGDKHRGILQLKSSIWFDHANQLQNQNEMNFMVTAKKKTLQIISVLVALESGEATQWSWFPFQSVITPPAPSITGISERKSYGCEKEKITTLIRWEHYSYIVYIRSLTNQKDCRQGKTLINMSEVVSLVTPKNYQYFFSSLFVFLEKPGHNYLLERYLYP